LKPPYQYTDDDKRNPLLDLIGISICGALMAFGMWLGYTALVLAFGGPL